MSEIVKKWSDLINDTVKTGFFKIMAAKGSGNGLANPDLVSFISDTARNFINLAVDTKMEIEIETEARMKAKRLQKDLKDAERDERVMKLLEEQEIDFQPKRQKAARKKRVESQLEDETIPDLDGI